MIPLEVRRRIKLTGAELEEFRVKEKVGIPSLIPHASSLLHHVIIHGFLVSDSLHPSFLQEKDKKTVSSLVEAALDEESDSDEEEMEVVQGKVGWKLASGN